jgi:NADPH-dependent F420 reductase
MDVAVIGGTGEEGFGLTLRLGKAGHHVTIGSRDAERGAAAAARAVERLDGAGAIDGTTNEEAAAAAPVVLVTVPFAGQADIYRSVRDAIAPGTVVMDATSPLATAVGGKAWQVVRPWHGSAAEQAQAILAGGVRMVAAFHTVAGHALQDLETPLDSDVLVCGDDADAKALVMELARSVTGRDGVDAGRLRLARQLEPLTAVLISINKRYKTRSGIAIAGLPGRS